MFSNVARAESEPGYQNRCHCGVLAPGLVDAERVGRKLAGAGLLLEGERAYEVLPWKRYHCGWSPANFAPVILDVLQSGITPRIGVLTTENGEVASADEFQRITVLPDAFASQTFDDAQVVYIVKPDRTPRPVVQRHGTRKRQRA